MIVTTAIACSFSSRKKIKNSLGQYVIRVLGWIRSQSIWLLVFCWDSQPKTRKAYWRSQYASVIHKPVVFLREAALHNQKRMSKATACLMKQEETSVLCSQSKHTHNDRKPPARPHLLKTAKLPNSSCKGPSVSHLGLWTTFHTQTLLSSTNRPGFLLLALWTLLPCFLLTRS